MVRVNFMLSVCITNMNMDPIRPRPLAVQCRGDNFGIRDRQSGVIGLAASRAVRRNHESGKWRHSIFPIREDFPACRHSGPGADMFRSGRLAEVTAVPSRGVMHDSSGCTGFRTTFIRFDLYRET